MTNNPVQALERYPEEKRATFAYTLEQEGKLAEALGQIEYSWLRLAILTGLRQANQFSLCKEWVDLEAGIVLVPQTKNRQPRVVLLSQEAAEILRAQMARHPDSPWVFLGFRRTQQPLNPRWYYIRSGSSPRASRRASPSRRSGSAGARPGTPSGHAWAPRCT